MLPLTSLTNKAKHFISRSNLQNKLVFFVFLTMV